MNIQALLLSLYVAGFVFLINGGTELLGASFKEKGNWKWKNHITSISRIAISIIIIIICAIFIEIDLFRSTGN